MDYKTLEIEGRIARLNEQLRKEKAGWSSRSQKPMHLAKRDNIMRLESEIETLKSQLPSISREQKRLSKKINRAYGESFFTAADKNKVIRGTLGQSWETKKDEYWSK